MNLRKYLLSCALMLATSVTVFSQAAKPIASTDGKTAAPAFSLTSMEGKKFDLASLRGKVVVINFWFTGCPPCIEEMPKLNELVEKFKDKDVVFIAPTWDNEATLKDFLKGRAFKYHVVPNAGEMIIVTYSDGSGTVELPTHIVIDKEGKIDMRASGALVTKDGTKRLDDLQKSIVRLIDSQSGKSK